VNSVENYEQSPAPGGIIFENMGEKSASVAVEPANADDADEISELAESIWQVCYAELLAPEQIRYMLDWMYAPAQIREEIQEREIVYRWISHNGERVGFAASGPGADGLDVVVHKLYISPDWQRCGLGSEALAAIEAAARSIGARRMTLRVNRGNEEAIRAYERFGFERDSEVCTAIGGGFVMDDYVMAKTLRA